MIKAVFFDVSNTLLHKPELFDRIERVLSNRHINIDADQIMLKHKLLSEIVTFPDKTSKDFYTLFNTELLYLLGVPPSTEMLDELFASCSYLPWEPFEDVETLGSIGQSKGVLSNWDDTLPDKLKSHFLFSFDWVLGSQLEGVRKPDPVFFNKMIEATNCRADEIVYVGDSLKLDIIPAINAGVEAVLIDRLNVYKGSPVNRITNLKQLKAFL